MNNDAYLDHARILPLEHGSVHHAPRFGRWQTLARSGGKLSVREVRVIRQWAADHPELSAKQQAQRLAPVFHVGVQTVVEILAHRAWSWVKEDRTL